MPESGPATAEKAQQPQARAPEAAGSDSEFLPPGAMGILELQRKAGNRAVTAAIASGSMWSTLGSRHMPVQLMPAIQRWAGNRAAVSLQRQRLTVQAEAAEGPTITEDESEAPSGSVPVQRQSVTIQRQKRKIEFVPFKIPVTKPMTPDEFEALALRQVFGASRPNVHFVHYTNAYDPAKSPYLLRVETNVLKQQRTKASKDRGIAVDEGGGVTGAEERAKTFQTSEATDKGEVLNEIDRRYYEAIGAKADTKIKPDEKGKAELWKSIRDEVLFQQEYIKNLPPKVQELIKTGVQGRDLTPADYDRFFAIAKKIERMPAAQVSDLASKVTASTSDLATFDASIDQYLAQTAERAKKVEARQGLKDKLAGLQDTYKRYLEWYYYPPGKMANQKGRLKTALEAELKIHGFDSVEAFEGAIEGFFKDFELGSLEIANDLLDKYAGKLFRESTRYTDQKEVTALHGKLGGVRTSQADYEANIKIWEAQVRARARRGREIHVYGDPMDRRAAEAYKKADAAKTVRQQQLKALSAEYPIFQEEGLPEDEQIDKSALAKATESTLGGLLQRHINGRVGAVKKARDEIKDDREVIYKMTKLMPTFYAKQGITPGSIYDLALKDKMEREAVSKVFKGIALAIVAIAIAVVTLGTATPALLAAGAGIAGAGLGAYQAYESYQEYTQEKNLASVGFADDPSIIWVVIAVAGAAADMGAAVKAVSALGKAAKALETGGDIKAFMETVKQLEKQEQITADIARAAEKAGAARAGFKAASGQFKKALGKLGTTLNMGPGSLGDPDVYKAVFNMAREAIKTKVYDLAKFIEELKLMRAEAKLGEMPAEDLAKVKQAWQEAKALQAAEDAQYDKLLKIVGDETKLNSLIGAAGDATKLERLLTVFKEPELSSIFAQLKNPAQLATAIEHIGPETTAGMIRRWMAKGASNPKHLDVMNEFLEHSATAVGKEFAEKAPLGAKAWMIDSQTAIAIAKDADPILRKGMSAGETAIVADIKSLPAGTELRVGNVTVGEVGSGTINARGVPLGVARDSPEYSKVLKVLRDAEVGGTKGIADQGIVADAMFANVEPGVTRTLASSDPGMLKGLARIADVPIDVDKIGLPKIIAKFGPPGFKGFEVTINGRTLLVIPLHG